VGADSGWRMRARLIRIVYLMAVLIARIRWIWANRRLPRLADLLIEGRARSPHQIRTKYQARCPADYQREYHSPSNVMLAPRHDFDSQFFQFLSCCQAKSFVRCNLEARSLFPKSILNLARGSDRLNRGGRVGWKFQGIK
jgi:hypothetical protein